MTIDVLIVGSGPSGVQAAAAAVARGVNVALVDVGETQDPNLPAVPDVPFESLRRTDPDQSKYLLGDPATALANLARAGAHLTPPRQYMIRKMAELFATESDTFLPLQATSAGGLGVSWGANVYTMSDGELARIGIDAAAIKPYYAQTCADVGVSGTTDAFGKLIADLPGVQQPLPLDTNAATIKAGFDRRAEKYNRGGFFLGQAALAVLSAPMGDRAANPGHDMDFYSDAGRSVYRPQFTLQQLRTRPNFTYLPGRLAKRFVEVGGGVELLCDRTNGGGGETIAAKRLILTAGAINTGRLVLQSLRGATDRLPILCNPNHWVAAINLAMLGRPAGGVRYSLAQLAALQTTPDDADDFVLGQFYSYRSLLAFRVLRGIPLPPAMGVTFMRLIATAFTCVNLHFSDQPAESKYLQLKIDDTFFAHYRPTAQQAAVVKRSERAMLKRLVGLRCIPIGVARPAHGASIHYAGTVPVDATDRPMTCDSSGKLRGTQNVFIGDGSSWRFLPAKGLTFTLMANARRISDGVTRGLS